MTASSREERLEVVREETRLKTSSILTAQGCLMSSRLMSYPGQIVIVGENLHLLSVVPAN